mgnify:CR=1 FL=1
MRFYFQARCQTRKTAWGNADFGGAIDVGGELTILDSTLANNSSGFGGAIQVASQIDKGTVVTILPDDGSKYVSLGIFDMED